MRPSALVRKAVKVAALPPGWLARRHPGDVSILLYHSIGPGTKEIELSPVAFEGHLAMLSGEGYPVASLDEALAGGRGGVVITFDDGYADFHERALPLLVRYRVPALLYVATGMVAEEVRSNGSSADMQGLSWSQLREAVDSGLVSIGAHTHNHADLSRATEGEAEEEMRRSKDLVEDRLGVSCRHFAYPWAVGSPGADRAARRLFDSAALAWQTNRSGRIDPYRLGRTPVLQNDGAMFFRAKVEGQLDAEALAYRVLRRGPWRKR